MMQEISTVPALDAETWCKISGFGFQVLGAGKRVTAGLWSSAVVQMNHPSTWFRV